MRIFLRVLGAFVVILILVGLGFWISSWQSDIAAAQPPARNAFADKDIARGAQLAGLGDCVTCHTLPGGAPFAGGRAIPTPYGVIYGPNITPDPNTGIGRWPQQAFLRAMRRGVDRGGHYLYPAFPYDHFTKATDEDINAIYSYLMTREPVEQRNQPNQLSFPFNLRFLMAGWNALFLKVGAFQPDPKQNQEWNRGAYLVEGLGHCGACHTPRNWLSAEDQSRRFFGATAEGWDAPPLTRTSPAPVTWTADQLYAYLRTGSASQHGIAAGPMMEVVRDLASVPDEDVRAMAVYIASFMSSPTEEKQDKAKDVLAKARTRPPLVSHAGGNRETTGAGPAAKMPGAAIYAGACATCHNGRQTGMTAAVDLSLTTDVNADSPRNLIQVMLNGIHPPAGERGAIMPSFAGTFTDDQMTELINYVRSAFSQHGPWNDVKQQIARVKQGKDS